jgi:hypothetical protein
MYAAHFAAALAIKGRAPEAPAWALITAAFLPDAVWITLAGAGIEPTGPTTFFDDWSHSLLSIATEATAFALIFLRQGRRVWAPIWLAGASHFLLDLPIHPRLLALYPHSAVHLGAPLWDWGAARSWLGMSHYWWVQAGATAILLVIYLSGVRRAAIAPNLAVASCLTVVGLHFLL